MFTKSKISPCLWFDGNGEEAARFTTSPSQLIIRGRSLKLGEEHLARAGNMHGQRDDISRTSPTERVARGVEFRVLHGEC